MVLHGEKMEHEHVMISMQLAAEGYCVWNKYKADKTKKTGIILFFFNRCVFVIRRSVFFGIWALFRFFLMPDREYTISARWCCGIHPQPIFL